MAGKKGGGSVVNVSKEKLLEATLLSLETLGRQGKTGVDGSGLNDYSSTGGGGGGAMRGSSGGSVASTDHQQQQQQGPAGGSIASSSAASSYTSSAPYGPHPPEPYLRGALWLGRNLTMVIEEMAEGMDHFRVKQLAEISTATADPDMSRALHRLSLLAASGQ